MEHGGVDFWIYLRNVVGARVDSIFGAHTCLGCGDTINKFQKGRMCHKCFLLLMELTSYRNRVKKNFNILPDPKITELIQKRLNPEMKDIPLDPAELSILEKRDG